MLDSNAWPSPPFPTLFSGAGGKAACALLCIVIRHSGLGNLAFGVELGSFTDLHGRILTASSKEWGSLIAAAVLSAPHGAEVNHLLDRQRAVFESYQRTAR